jgi:hypothetical protein
MLDDVNTAPNRRSRNAGLGAVAFGVMTLVAMFLSDSPGGSYSAADVSTYLSRGDRPTQLISFFLAMFAIPGLVYMLAHLRDTLAATPERHRAASIVWGTGLAAAACFAIGWGVDGGQIFAHWEGGSAVAIPAPVTYLISEIGVVFIFGCGAMLLGFALITCTLSAKGLLPTWLRGVVFLIGMCGVAGLAWATFFVMLLGTAGVGIWLMTRGREATSRELAVSPTA